MRTSRSGVPAVRLPAVAVFAKTVGGRIPVATLVLVCLAALTLGCKSGNSSANTSTQAQDKPFMSTVAGPPPLVATADQAPPPDKTGGFDGQRAYDQVAKQVSYGPRVAGSQPLAQLQNYIESELKSYGCAVDTDSFSADTPAGRLPMKNIVAKIPGQTPGIILLGTHYDTKRLEDFVGADDAGSSTAVMLEIARNLCARRQPEKYAVWIAFFDGEEAVNVQWKDPDNRYGSRQMAAKMATSGDLPKVKAFILADIVGGRIARFRRDPESTPWVVDLVWKEAARLSYSNVFISEVGGPGGDDHMSFTTRHVPSVDIIDLDPRETPYWHTPQDTLDKLSPKTLAIVGHTILASVEALQKR